MCQTEAHVVGKRALHAPANSKPSCEDMVQRRAAVHCCCYTGDLKSVFMRLPGCFRLSDTRWVQLDLGVV